MASAFAAAAARSISSGPGAWSAKSAARSSAGNGKCALARTDGGRLEKSASTASTPSRLVPDMRPTYSALSLKQCEIALPDQLEAHGERVGLGPESRDFIRRNRQRSGQYDRKRVAGLPGGPEFGVQVRSGCPPGLADRADDVALGHVHALAQAPGKAHQVRVHGRDISRVANDDYVSVAALLAHEIDHAVADAPHP